MLGSAAERSEGGGSMSVLTVAPPVRVVPVLARAEAVRLLLHPVTLVGYGLWALMTSTLWWGDPPRPLDVFESVGSALSWMPGVLMILVGYLVATREHRAGTIDVLGSLPSQEPERVRALCLASLAPGAVALVLNLALTGVLQDRFAQSPTVPQLLQAPLTVVGATLLGVMVAAWAPVAFAPALTVVVMIGAHVALGSDPVASLFGPAVFWAEWGVTGGELWHGFIGGSHWWHLAYVVGLCGLAAAAAIVRSVRTRAVVTAGFAVLAVTVLAAVLQLP
jgi:hypothetical protein